MCAESPLFAVAAQIAYTFKKFDIDFFLFGLPTFATATVTIARENGLSNSPKTYWYLPHIH